MNDVSNESNDCNETNDTSDNDSDENGCWKAGWRWLCWMRRLRFKSIENKYIITEWSNGDERDNVVVIVGEGLLDNDDKVDWSIDGDDDDDDNDDDEVIVVEQ